MVQQELAAGVTEVELGQGEEVLIIIINIKITIITITSNITYQREASDPVEEMQMAEGG